MSETTGHRLYLIRLACGDGVRKAEPLDVFARRVRKKTGVAYDPSTVSLLERMKQKWKLEDISVFAAVDPDERGPAWLAWGDSPAPVLLDPTKDRGLSEEEEERALAEAERIKAARKSRNAKKKRKGGGESA